MAQRNNLNRKPTRFSVVPFFRRQGFFWHKFEGATTLSVGTLSRVIKVLPLAQTNNAERSTLEFTRIKEEITSSSGYLYEAGRKWYTR